MNLKKLIETAKKLKQESDDREFEMLRLKGDVEYVAQELIIEKAQKRKAEIIGTNEKHIAYLDAMAELRKYMEEQGIYETDGAKLKKRTSSKVNPVAVRVTLDDDDMFMSLVEIPIGKLKTLAKELEGMKKPLESCIEEVKTEITGLELIY